jgi:membrane protease YdiL (CAAX protease family)
MSTSNSLIKLRPSALSAQSPQALRPLAFWPSLLLTALPAGLVAFSFYVFRPFLENAGNSPLESFLASILVATALLFAGALIGYHRVENRPLDWSAFSQRMRFPSLTPKMVLQGLGLFLVLMAGYGLFSRLGLALVQAGLIPVPTTIPALADPRVGLSRPVLEQMAGGSIAGNWDAVLLYLVAFFFNIAGEELWWRGYLLPRQELAFGRSAWLLHGLLWTVFHAFKWWDMIGLLPVCLAISFSAQRLKNNWPALIAHALFNGLSLLAVIAGAAGMI